ncbi:MAG: phosphonate C-P lyase system protein PhnH [Chloroflexota bacterium]|nr:phosphonate C-P lyase system protein PhnH [Chloroflexota bacterium]
MTLPIYTADEARDRETFLALMWALSYPGRVHALPQGVDSMPQIGDALLDLETTFYTPDAAIADQLLRTGARALPPAEAAYHFYPSLDDAALGSLAEASRGTMLRPDEGATLIIGCAFASGSVFTLTGPGIKDTQNVRLGGIPARFWSLRKQAIRYPMGWDVYLVDGRDVIGLPRTTMIENGD